MKGDFPELRYSYSLKSTYYKATQKKKQGKKYVYL